MITEGADHAKHDGSEQSARAIIERVVDRSPIYLHIQEELHAGIEVRQTEAVKALEGELLRTVGDLKIKLDTVNRRLAKADKRNTEMKEALDRMEQDVTNKITNTRAELQKLTSLGGELKHRIAMMEARPPTTAEPGSASTSWSPRSCLLM